MVRKYVKQLDLFLLYFSLYTIVNFTLNTSSVCIMIIYWIEAETDLYTRYLIAHLTEKTTDQSHGHFGTSVTARSI